MIVPDEFSLEESNYRCLNVFRMFYKLQTVHITFKRRLLVRFRDFDCTNQKMK